MNIARTLLLLATLIAASNCRAQDFMPIPFPSLAYELNGFAIEPPSGQRWLVKREATRDQVRFMRSTDQGSDHTVIAWAEIFEWPRATDTVNDILRQITAPVTQAFKEQSRYSNVRIEIIDSRSTGLPCGEFLFSAEDRGVPYAPGKTFIIQGWEIYCLHHMSPKPLVLKRAHSQRYLIEGKMLPLDEELKIFREGVQVRPVSAPSGAASTSPSAKQFYDSCITIETKNGLAGSASRKPMNPENASRFAHLLCSIIADRCATEPQSENCKKSLKDYGLRD